MVIFHWEELLKKEVSLIDDFVPEVSIPEKCRFMTVIIKSTDFLPVSAPFTSTIDIQISFISGVRSSRLYLSLLCVPITLFILSNARRKNVSI